MWTKKILRLKKEADAEAAKDGSTYVEDAGRGYRKVVPSPMPKEIVEKEAVRALVEADVLTSVLVAGHSGRSRRRTM